jgi:hypothetical protein
MNADLACQRALDRLNSAGFEALTEQEKTLATVWSLQAGVENAGFVHYYLSNAGDLAFHGPVAFERLGAQHMAGLIKRANALFGPEGPSRDRTTRSAQVHALDEVARQTLEGLGNSFLESDDDTDPLIDAYLARG